MITKKYDILMIDDKPVSIGKLRDELVPVVRRVAENMENKSQLNDLYITESISDPEVDHEGVKSLGNEKIFSSAVVAIDDMLKSYPWLVSQSSEYKCSIRDKTLDAYDPPFLGVHVPLVPMYGNEDAWVSVYDGGSNFSKISDIVTDEDIFSIEDAVLESASSVVYHCK